MLGLVVIMPGAPQTRFVYKVIGVGCNAYIVSRQQSCFILVICRSISGNTKQETVLGSRILPKVRPF